MINSNFTWIMSDFTATQKCPHCPPHRTSGLQGTNAVGLEWAFVKCGHLRRRSAKLRHVPPTLTPTPSCCSPEKAAPSCHSLPDGERRITVGVGSMGATEEDAAAAAEEGSATNQRTQSLKGCSSSVGKFYPVDSPLKKRKSEYGLVDPKLLSLKYKFRKRLSQLEDESATTESIGCDGFFINNNCGTDMVSIPEELDSCENTLSIFGGCIEVDSKNGIEGQSMNKIFQARLSGSSSSSNIFSSDASSSRSTGTKETESWIMHDDECYHPDLVLQRHNNDMDRMYDEQYDDIMDGELADGDVHGSPSRLMDEKLYSNGADDFQILPTGQTSSHGEKKLTIDQEFEQYFSRLML